MKNKKIILIVLICLSFLGLLFYFSQAKNSNPIGLASGVSFQDNIPGSISVYDFMNTLRAQGKINFTAQNYIGMGEFIDSINGIKNNQNQSWIYYVNNIEAQVGVSNYKIKPGDILSFKYEKSNY
ncbi:MAG: DUF4430 domain-containing protein [Minisyncoccia bacterium]